MMAQRTVSDRIWTGNTGRKILALGHNHMLIALYLITCPQSDWTGIFNIDIPSIAIALGFWKMEKPTEVKGLRIVEMAISDLQSIGFCRFDSEAGLIYLPEIR
jgi:hypothetical protein